MAANNIFFKKFSIQLSSFNINVLAI